MNVRKAADYSALHAALDQLMPSVLPQMELYREIGRLVSGRPEKGAAVTAAEYLRAAYPDVPGFSPRNLRRMRDFYRAYEDAPEMMAEAMAIGWTQNVVILEAELTLQENAWYIRAVRQFGWSKLKLAERITASAHLEMGLDVAAEVCYTEENSVMERVNDDEHPFYLPRQDVRNPAKPLKINEFGTLSVSTLPTFYQQQRANRYNTPKHPLRRLNPSSGCFFIPPPSSSFPLSCSMIAKIQVPPECDKIAL